MTSKKSLPVYGLLLASVMLAFAVKGISNSTKYAVGPSHFKIINSEVIPEYTGVEPKIVPNKYEKILRNVMAVMKELHYAPRQVDDALSKIIFNDYLKNLDNGKDLFTQSEIESLRSTFETKIDDELQLQVNATYFSKAGEMYKANLESIEPYVLSLLEQPFDFTATENFDGDPEKKSFPKDEVERKDAWRKKMKWMVLERLNDLINQNETAKVKKTQTELEKEAREKVLKIIKRNFEGQKKKATVDEYFKTFVNTVVQTYDPHTDYFPPVDKRSFDEEMSGSYFGIGAQLKEEDGNIKIGPLTYNSPAQKSGQLDQGDILMAVGQGENEAEDITGYGTRDVVKLIRGKLGTEVRLTLKKADGTIKIVKLIRQELALEGTFAKSSVVEKDGKKYGVIYLPEFYANFEKADGRRCAQDVAKEIIKLKMEGIDGIVMDLRNNGGGSLYDVIKMVGLFIPDGPVVQVKDRIESIKTNQDNDGNLVLWDGPLTVLINEFSASASEIFAAAIQDHKRGIVLGSTSSFGKGTVQRQISLNFDDKKMFDTDEFGSLKVTMQKFYRINGGSTQKKGVESDVVLPDVYEYYKFREKDMDYVMEWDEISKAAYKGDYGFTFTDVINNSKNRVANNSVFNSIKDNAQKINLLNDKVYSLNLEAFRKEQKELKVLSDALDQSLKGRAELPTRFMKIDEAAFFIDKDKTETNKKFLELISKDLYIHEAINVIADLVNTKQVAIKK